MGACAIGRSGGYPGTNDIVVFAHDTNIREILENGVAEIVAGRETPYSLAEDIISELVGPGTK